MLYFKTMSTSLIFTLFLLTTTTELFSMLRKPEEFESKSIKGLHLSLTQNEENNSFALKVTRDQEESEKTSKNTFSSITVPLDTDKSFSLCVRHEAPKSLLKTIIKSKIVWAGVTAVVGVVLLKKDKIIRTLFPNNFKEAQTFFNLMIQAYNQGKTAKQEKYENKYQDAVDKMTNVTSKQNTTLKKNKTILDALEKTNLSSLLQKKINDFDGLKELVVE